MGQDILCFAVGFFGMRLVHCVQAGSHQRCCEERAGAAAQISEDQMIGSTTVHRYIVKYTVRYKMIRLADPGDYWYRLWGRGLGWVACEPLFVFTQSICLLAINYVANILLLRAVSEHCE